ncbi:CDP-alcohol phosphatidyltransferase family protein [Nocardioides sp. HDW12B]|uniref:CDP-alcohol phosphatidyltransferase family protein n=1 Tax=Nocardioides sp. HDW12B TaxID=2714939 RepID=UPI001408ABA5|nr:CDP-alcohol phosphatidyltransferase family protein [Nocardioides sp. HDW12B]QIK65381.1 CDP-alcohol phosphatidyltransferase family protein [Nocardioides sp. HDW12B]
MTRSGQATGSALPDRSYRANLGALESAQKPSFGTPAYSRYVNRPLARRVAAAAHSFGTTPNQATALSAVLSALGLALLALVEPSPPQAFAVGALLAGGYVMDSVDGQLARLRGGGSVSGEWLDHLVDCFKTTLLHLCVLVSWYRFPPVEETSVLLVPMAFLVVASATYFSVIVMPFLRRQAGAPARRADVANEHPLRKWLTLPADHGFVCWIFVLLAWPGWFATAYGALAVLSAGLLAVAVRAWWRELSAADRAPRPST